jgi:hypothetical protein
MNEIAIFLLFMLTGFVGVGAYALVAIAHSTINANRNPARTDWRDISTQPNDGGCVLFRDEYGNKWIDVSPGHPNNACGYPATQWMPLPE